MRILFDIMRFNAGTCCIISFSCAYFLTINAEQDALIFNRKDDSLFLLPNNIPSQNVKLGAWVTACPAETKPEEDFIKNSSSLKKNGLFVKKIYEKDSEPSKVEKNICQSSYEISLAFNVRSLSFQFGYEIYYKYKDRDEFDDHYNPQDYKLPNQVIKKLKTRYNEGIFKGQEFFRILGQSVLGIGTKKLWIGKERMEFKWFYLFKLKFDLHKKILEETWHEIQANNRWKAPEICEDYSLGSELYEGIDLDSLYSGHNQVKIFEIFQETSQFCKKVDKPCLMKWPLIPFDQFSFGSEIPPLCSNIITVPIWSGGKTEYILRKLDQFLYALFRVLKEPIHVTSGIIGAHEFFLEEDEEEKAVVYLDLKNGIIPIPKLVYRIVEYQLKDCHLNENSCWYSAAVVIINDPHFGTTYDYKVCAEDVAEAWGWDLITKNSEGEPYGIIYVCENNKAMQHKLKVKSTERVAGGLNLSKFVYSEDGGDTLKMKDIKAQVEGTFRKLSDVGEDVDLEMDEIVERVQFQDNVSDDSKE